MEVVDWLIDIIHAKIKKYIDDNKEFVTISNNKQQDDPNATLKQQVLTNHTYFKVYAQQCIYDSKLSTAKSKSATEKPQGNCSSKEVPSSKSTTPTIAAPGIKENHTTVPQIEEPKQEPAQEPAQDLIQEEDVKAALQELKAEKSGAMEQEEEVEREDMEEEEEDDDVPAAKKDYKLEKDMTGKDFFEWQL